MNIETFNNFKFSCGQISHNPSDYFYSLDGDVVLGLISTRQPEAIIKIADFSVHVYLHVGFAMQIVFGNKGELPCTVINCRKMLSNCASPECIVNACKEELAVINSRASTRLEARRKAAGYTLAKLSELSGVHAQLIARFERMERDISNSSYKTVKKLADALQCHPEDIA
ncbi:MAG: helix-turn-helix domain-containing protein [Ruminococcus sp.]|nr:helix-turn-helix domain-containing protein [Ruminococcus sp.]